MSPRITRQQLGGAPPVPAERNALSFPTIPLPADRAEWPTLDATVMARVLFALRFHNCIPDARLIIRLYGGSSELLTPLFRAAALANVEPVALDDALGGTGHPLRLAYVLSGLGGTQDVHPSLLAFSLDVIRMLLGTGQRADQHVADYLAERVVGVFGEAGACALRSADFDPIRSPEFPVHPKIQTTWDRDTGNNVSTIRLF
ncbi:MAG: hypothetical protein IT355_13205 [Gemmatimonadaceae bacterium]|nr:hypothetical protein [Gemmatimonadaceae bacterium]